MQIQTNEARIILAIEAIRISKKLSRRKATKIYNIPETTLRDRMNGRTTLSERRPAVQKLTEMEEEIIVQYIFDRDSRGFSPRLTDVEDMANYLLDAHRAKHVGKLWAHRFVARRLELKTRFNRVYDFQRALCEDPELIGA
jgi:helix-turn-helix, Psq domain